MTSLSHIRSGCSPQCRHHSGWRIISPLLGLVRACAPYPPNTISVNRRIDRLTRTHVSFPSLTDQVRVVEMGPDSSLPGSQCISTVAKLGYFVNPVQRFPDRGLEYADAASIAPLHSASTIGIPSLRLVRANSACVLLGLRSFSHSHAELPVCSPNILFLLSLTTNTAHSSSPSFVHIRGGVVPSILGYFTYFFNPVRTLPY